MVLILCLTPRLLLLCTIIHCHLLQLYIVLTPFLTSLLILLYSTEEFVFNLRDNSGTEMVASKGSSDIIALSNSSRFIIQNNTYVFNKLLATTLVLWLSMREEIFRANDIGLTFLFTVTRITSLSKGKVSMVMFVLSEM